MTQSAHHVEAQHYVKSLSVNVNVLILGDDNEHIFSDFTSLPTFLLPSIYIRYVPFPCNPSILQSPSLRHYPSSYLFPCCYVHNTIPSLKMARRKSEAAINEVSNDEIKSRVKPRPRKKQAVTKTNSAATKAL